MAGAAGLGAGVPDTTTWDGIEEVVRELFGGWEDRAGGVIWSAGFRSVAQGESWHGRAGLEWLRQSFGDMNADLYICIAVMDGKPGPDGKPPRRSNAGAVAQPLLIVDDVGTKVDPEKWEELFRAGCPRPTLQVETSPGNQTWFWALDGDAMGPQRWTDLALTRAWLVERGLTDEVMDVARYVRLPGGWNSKPKYLAGADGQGSGVPPRVTMVAWRPGRVDLDAVAGVVVGGAGGAGTGVSAWRQADFPASASGRALMNGAQLGALAGAGALVRSADLGKPEPIMRLWQECGGVLVQRGPGVVEALCPNIGAHSTRRDTGFAFLGGGLMHCNHASCQGLSTVEFRSMMMQAFDDRQTMRALTGQLGQGEARTAGEYLARESFRDLGGLSDAGEAEEVAERMARAREGRRAQAAAALAAGIDGLAERFVWVNSVGVFFDTVERVVVPGDTFDTHPAVLDVIPVGKSGEKRARNMVLNHAGLRRGEGMVRAAGSDEAIVDMQDDTGHVRRMVNVWKPSVWAGRRAKRHPAEWLELLEYVIPDAGYREWFIKWLAWLFQRPGQRLLTIPLIVGGQGVGKDAILGAIKILLGRHNIQTLSMNQIGAAFNQWMLTDLVILPELKLSGDGKMYNQIKDWTANPEEWVQINEKFQRPYTTRVTFSMISMTNHLDALPGLEADDRRWQIYLSPAKAAPRAFYNRVVDGSKTDAALAGLLDYLLDVDLTGFSAFEPAPGGKDAKRAMLADTLRGSAQWTYQALQEGGRFFGRNIVTIEEVEAAALAEQNSRVSKGTDTRPVRDGLRAAGWENEGRVRFGQDRKRLWISPDLKGSAFYAMMQPKDLAAAYLAEKDAHDRKIASQLFGGT